MPRENIVPPNYSLLMGLAAVKELAADAVVIRHVS